VEKASRGPSGRQGGGRQLRPAGRGVIRDFRLSLLVIYFFGGASRFDQGVSERERENAEESFDIRETNQVIELSRRGLCAAQNSIIPLPACVRSFDFEIALRAPSAETRAILVFSLSTLPHTNYLFISA
jgi:hypothetical protein